MKRLLLFCFLTPLLLFAACGFSETDVSEIAPETESVSSPETSQISETAAEKESGATIMPETETVTSGETEMAGKKKAGPEVPEGPVKEMIRLGLSFVSRSYGYSLYDRTGTSGAFDCSGLVAVLLRDGLSEQTIGWMNGEPWDTAYWRYFATCYPEGTVLTVGNASYKVTMKESYDFENAWKIPGSIVLQYPPENDPSVKMGHISVALGEIPYQSTEDVIDYLFTEYGISLRGMAGGPNQIPMVYDPNGADSGHTTWKINANGIAEATCVDNNYASKPGWIERISMVLVPVF